MADTLKVYVDSTSLSLVRQVADFVTTADDPDHHHLLTWLRLPLTPAQLQGLNAEYLPQLAAVQADFITRVRRTLAETGARRLVVHGNQTHAWRGVMPILAALQAAGELARLEVSLELYDDGTLSLQHRDTMSGWGPSLPDRIEAGARALREALHGRARLGPDIAHSHAWHRLLPTRYHVLRPDLLLHDAAGQAVWDWLAPLAEPMRFDGLPGLSPGQCDRYLALFGIDQALVDGLGTLPGAPDGLLYTGTGCWDPVEHDRMLGHQLDAIARLQDQGLLAPGLRLGYKGHPASRRGDERLLERLGPDTVVYPHQVPLEVLSMAGLLPAMVGGVLSSSYASLPPTQIAFALFHPMGGESAARDELLEQVLRTGWVDPHKLLLILGQGR